MRIISISDDAIAEAVKIIRAGGVVAHPTETCYGLACDLSNPSAVEKVFRIKDRAFTQPISGLFSSVENAKKYVTWNARAEELANGLPGPLTLVLPLSAKLFPTPAGGSTIGVRVSSHSFAMQLAKEFGSPISTTSANLHGKANPYSADDIRAQFVGREHQPDLVIDGGLLAKKPPSDVIDLSSETEKKLR